MLIEKKYVDAKWTRPFARAIGAIPVDRKDKTGDPLRAAIDTIEAGATVLLLPEGKLHWDPEQPLTTGRAATGVARIATGAGVPVVAAGMVGTEQVWPATSKLPARRSAAGCGSRSASPTPPSSSPPTTLGSRPRRSWPTCAA
ncbi:MAG: lysophospholipid acyltransferase family protein [Acidimicrobiales bacterium]